MTQPIGVGESGIAVRRPTYLKAESRFTTPQARWPSAVVLLTGRVATCFGGKLGQQFQRMVRGGHATIDCLL